MQSASLPRALYWPGRIIDALCDNRRANAVIVAILVCYGALWTLYAIVSKSTQAIHPDMAEVAAWSAELEWGTPKHPPLLPALVRAWFFVFPAADWSYYLLAVTLVTVAIYFCWLLAGEFLDGVKRAVVPFFLMLIPFYNFLALKLDHNVVLIPLWAATTFCFVKAYRTRAISWAIATGLCAGLAVLAKYWSFFLLAGLALAVLIGPHRRAFFRSPAPIVITAVSLGVFLPHILWLEANGFPTFEYARHRQAEDHFTLVQGLWSYALGMLGYISVPILMLAALEPTFRRQFSAAASPEDRERRFVAIMLWAPLISSMVFAMLTYTRLGAVWTMSGLSLVGVLVLMTSSVTVTRTTAARMALVAMVLSVGAAVASPVVAWSRLVHGVENDALYVRDLARKIEDVLVAQKIERPRYLVGSYSLANGVAFYMNERPLPMPLETWVVPRWGSTADPDDIVTLCVASDESCRKNRRVHPMAEWITIEIEPRWLDFRGARETFVLERKPPVSSDTDSCCTDVGARDRRVKTRRPAL